MPKTKVKRTAEDEPVEVLAREIQAIAKAARKLMEGGLKRRTVYLLISKSSGVGQRQVAAVLDAAANLDIEYLEVEL